MAKRKAPESFFDEFDWLDGFSLEELLGSAPVSQPKGPGVVGRMISAPFRLLKALVLLPVRLVVSLVKLPFRMVRAILPPWGRRKSGRSRRT